MSIPFLSNMKRYRDVLPFNLLVWALLILYLSPVFFMIVTAMMPTEQLGDKTAPLYPARIMRYEYEGKEYQIYNVPMDGGEKPMALVKPGRETSLLIDPQHPENGLIEWKGNWRTLTGVYEFYIEWGNFTRLFTSLPFPQMLRNTFLLALIGGIGVLASSIVVA